jgi:hypothetical protein
VNEVAEAIYQRRTTITAVAAAVGLLRQDMSDVVNGHRLPSAEQLDAMCAFLAWGPTQLYPREEFRAAIEATRQAVAS